MSLIFIHILGGGVGLTAGFAALLTRKGSRPHRKAGWLFIGAMAMMAVSAFILSISQGLWMNLFSASLTCYLFVSALLAVRIRTTPTGLPYALMLAAALLIAAGYFGVEWYVSHGGVRQDGVPPGAGYGFGTIAMIAAAGDLRLLLRPTTLPRVKRITRHLWRMCFATFIASGSLFLGQADEFPSQIREMGLLPLAALFPLIIMLYWLARRAFEAIKNALPPKAGASA